MHQKGVIYRDVLFVNILFNWELKRVIMIDFERASLVEPRRPLLAQLVPNKRRQRPEERECKNVATLSCNTRQASKGFSEDINKARIVFRDLISPYGIAK
jgi:serine/threonine protein kinase